MKQIKRFLGGGVIAALVAVGAIAGVGVAGASEADVTITAVPPPEFAWDTPSVSVNTGDTVTWNTGAGSHNVKATNDVADDPNWKTFLKPGPGDFDPAPQNATYTYTFTRAGTYTYECRLHAGAMVGTVTVTGPPVDPTPTPTPTATPTPTPVPSGPPQTPPPSGTADTVKPTVRSIKLKAQHHAARVTFTLSENATVTIRVKRGSKVLKSLSVQARKGTRTVKVRSSKLGKGRFTIEVRARDAYGNRSALAKKRLRFAR